MKDRICVEFAENGYEIEVWKNEEKEESSEYMYVEPKKYVAKTKEEVLELIKKML